MTSPRLSQGDWDEFVAVCYFGGGKEGDWLDRCIRRGYLDMSRTLHGMAAFGRTHPEWQTRMKRLLKQQLCVLAQSAEWSQQGFDSWHEACVASMQELSDSLGYTDNEGPSRRRFMVGQAQKWINMSIKYAIVLGESRVPGFRSVYGVAHAPLDSIVLSCLKNRASICWSGIEEYWQYMRYEEALRQSFPGRTLLEIEYDIWQDVMKHAD